MTNPYYSDEWVTIYHGDALEILPAIETADLVLTDPPYVFGLASSDMEGKTGGWGDLMNNGYWFGEWLTQAKRITRNRNGAAWVFNSWRSFPVLARASHAINWPIRSLLVWDKAMLGMCPPNALRPTYELVVQLAHTDFVIPDRTLGDIWRVPWSAGLRHAGHPAEKPTALLSQILRASIGTRSGPLVVDPFLGSGSTLRAAKDNGWRAIGIEIEERWCEVAARRMGQEVMAFEPDERVTKWVEL